MTTRVKRLSHGVSVVACGCRSVLHTASACLTFFASLISFVVHYRFGERKDLGFVCKGSSSLCSCAASASKKRVKQIQVRDHALSLLHFPICGSCFISILCASIATGPFELFVSCEILQGDSSHAQYVEVLMLNFLVRLRYSILAFAAD